MQDVLTARTHAHPLRRSMARTWPRPGWKSAGVLALLCSGVAWASLPRVVILPVDEQRQWQALGVAPLSSGGVSGMPMAPSDAVEPVDFVPKRAVSVAAPVAAVVVASAAVGPMRIRGRVGDGLYWSLRAAGASPTIATEYLKAIATHMDVGEVAPFDRFDFAIAKGADGKPDQLIYAGIDRAQYDDVKLLKWNNNGQSSWFDGSAAPQVSAGLMAPVAGRITSGFGWRFHPILHFGRLHAGIDFGAPTGAPIVAAADGQVVAAGYAGGYGRQVRIVHSTGIVTTYSHMSSMAASPGLQVRQGQVIGYVGSSGLATGPHLHFEVRINGQPVNPLTARLVSRPTVQAPQLAAFKARLKDLLSIPMTPRGPAPSAAL